MPSVSEHDAAGDEAWLRADVCTRGHVAAAMAAAHHVTKRDSQLRQLRAGSQLLNLVRGNSSGGWSRGTDPMWVATEGGGRTTASLWLMAQLVRRVRYAVGPCTRARVDALLHEARQRLRASDAGVAATKGAAEGAAAGTAVDRRRRRLAVAVHIRRGDACERWVDGRANAQAAASAQPRPCFSARTYLEESRTLLARIQRHNPPSAADRAGDAPPPPPPWLLVATDSPDAVAELHRAMRPGEFELLHASGPRGAGWGGAVERRDGGQARDDFIEARNERQLVDRGAVVGSFFADLELLARADAFVGTAASFTSRVLLLAIIGDSGALPPFSMVDRPLRRLFFA